MRLSWRLLLVTRLTSSRHGLTHLLSRNHVDGWRGHVGHCLNVLDILQTWWSNTWHTSWLAWPHVVGWTRLGLGWRMTASWLCIAGVLGDHVGVARGGGVAVVVWTSLACDCILWSSRVTSLAAGIRAGVSRLRLGGQRVLRLWRMRLRMNQVGHLTRSCSVVGGLVVAHHHLVHRGSVHGLTVLSKGWLHVLTSLLGLAVVVMGSWMSPSWLLVTSSYQLVLIRLVMVVETVGVRRGSGGGGGHWPVHSDLTNTRHEHLIRRDF